MKLKLQLNGEKLQLNRATVQISLRQRGKGLVVPTDNDGLAKLENLPCEPLMFRLVYVSPYRYSDTNRNQTDFDGSSFYFNPKLQTELVVEMDKVK